MKWEEEVRGKLSKEWEGKSAESFLGAESSPKWVAIEQINPSQDIFLNDDHAKSLFFLWVRGSEDVLVRAELMEMVLGLFLE